MTDDELDRSHGGGSGHAPRLAPFVKAKRASTPDDDETWKEGEVAPTLNAFDNGGDSRATVVTVQDEAAGGDLPPEGVLAFGRQEDRLAGTVYEDEVPGLTTSKTYAVAVDVYNQTTDGDVAHTIRDGHMTGMPHALTAGIPSPPPVAYQLPQSARVHDADEVCPTLTSQASERRGGSEGLKVLTPDLAVRRLTPRECERLMGWPDDWTRWAADGSEVADSSRYRMCGNGVASPVAEWLGRCIVAAHEAVDA